METLVQRFFIRDLATDVPSGHDDALKHVTSTSMILGVALMLAGLAACYWFFTATIAAVYVLGLFMIGGGVLFGLNSFSARKWTVALFEVLAAVLYILAGLTTFVQPLIAAGVISLLVSLMFIFQGIARIFAALSVKPMQWQWMLFNGLVTLGLGVAIFLQWPVSTLWLLGTLIGVDMFLSGWTMLVAGYAVRKSQIGVDSHRPLRSSPA